MKRKSPKAQSALKASVEASLLKLEKKQAEGNLTSVYTTTEKGKEVVMIDID